MAGDSKVILSNPDVHNMVLFAKQWYGYRVEKKSDVLLLDLGNLKIL